MLKSLLLAASIVGLAVAPATAAPCRDGKGKFVKCPDKAPAKAVKCKDAKGRFAKCGTNGAKAI